MSNTKSLLRSLLLCEDGHVSLAAPRTTDFPFTLDITAYRVGNN